MLGRAIYAAGITNGILRCTRIMRYDKKSDTYKGYDNAFSIIDVGEFQPDDSTFIFASMSSDEVVAWENGARAMSACRR